MATHTPTTPPDRQPPTWADRLLKRFVPENLAEELLGDLHELFEQQVAEVGEAKARRLYALEVFKFCRPYFLKRRAAYHRQKANQFDYYPQPLSISPVMIRNYVKIAFRSLAKNKVYSFINVFGLALGMACALLIGLWVKDQLSYNRFLPDAKNICYVRVNFADPNTGEVHTNWATPGPLQEAIAQDVPEIAAVTKINYGPEYLIKVGEKAAKEKGHFATDDFFSVFDLPAVQGNPNAALKQTNQIVITRKVAEKFFPNGQALGKTLQLNSEKFYVVGAVIEDLPSTSSLQFGWLVNWKVQEQDWMKKWGNVSFQTFVRLKPHTTLAQAEAAMAHIYPRFAGKNFDTGRPTLQTITDLHLYGEYKNGRPVGGRIEYVRVFALVALFILLVACINFMNLSTARSATRAREVGVRKVVGALRSSLIGQFLSESILTSLLAAVLATVLVWIVLPTFNTVFGKQLTLNLAEPSFWIILSSLALVTGFVSGSYPALFLSSLQPIKILKGSGPAARLQTGAGPALFRRTLVVFQFSMSIFLIVGMLAVGRQMQYLRNKNLGLDRENVLYWPIEGINEPKKFEALQQEILRLPSIASATTTGSLPVNVQSSSGDLTWPGKDPNLSTNVQAMYVGSDFTKTMNIKLVDGRDFRADSPADSANYIINEATARMMGMQNRNAGSPVGREVEFWMGKGRIIGLMKDFHMQSLHEPIKPLILCFGSLNTSYLLVKTRAGQTQQALADLAKISKEFTPDYPFNYHFLE